VIPIIERPLEERFRAVWVANIDTGRAVAFVKFEDGLAISKVQFTWSR
jgi:hypothetical protein